MGCQPLASFLAFLGIVFVEFCDGLLDIVERPADGFGQLAEKLLLNAHGFEGRLGILEPSESFGGGGFFSGGGAFGRVGF